jgi:site-specific recombinase XerD
VGDFAPEDPSLHVRVSDGGQPRHVPLDAGGAAFFATLRTERDARAVMLVRADGQPWSASGQQRPMLGACAAGRVAPATSFHTLRHTYASHRVMKGAPLVVVAQVPGNVDSRMV